MIHEVKNSGAFGTISVIDSDESTDHPGMVLNMGESVHVDIMSDNDEITTISIPVHLLESMGWARS